MRGVAALRAATAGVAIAVAAATLAVVLSWSNRGLDLMDESYVLRLLFDPGSSRAAGEVYLFGFVFGPLLRLSGGDIAVLRLVGSALLAVVVGGAALESLRAMASVHRPQPRLVTAAAVLAAMSASLLVFTMGVRVPGYRALAALGLAVVIMGFAWLGLRRHLTGGALVGVGLWLVFAGRPPSAAALLVLTAAAVVGAGLWTTRALVGIVGGGLLAAGMTLAAAGMSPFDAVRYLSGGFQVVKALNDHSDLGQMLGLGPVPPGPLLFIGLPLALVLLASFALRERAGADRRPWVDAATTAVLLAVGLLQWWFFSRLPGPHAGGTDVLGATLVLGAAPVVWLARRVRHFRRWSFDEWFVVLLTWCPYAYSVGSNVPFAWTMGQTAFCWVIALGVITKVSEGRSRDHQSALPVVHAMVAVLVSVVLVFAHTGPRSNVHLDGRTQAAPVRGGTLLLAPAEARNAEALHRLALQEGVTERTPVIDVSGVGAGYALMLGGRPLGRAHFYTTWSGRLESARAALSVVDCEDIARAYVIRAADGTHDLLPALARGNPIDAGRDYSTVLQFTSVQFDRTWRMEVLRPEAGLRDRLGC